MPTMSEKVGAKINRKCVVEPALGPSLAVISKRKVLLNHSMSITVVLT